MMREALSHYPHGLLNGVAMLIFLAVFIGSVFWVFRRRSNELYSTLAAMPLSEPKPVTKGNEND